MYSYIYISIYLYIYMYAHMHNINIPQVMISVTIIGPLVYPEGNQTEVLKPSGSRPSQRYQLLDSSSRFGDRQKAPVL